MSSDYMPRGAGDSIKAMLCMEQDGLRKPETYYHFYVCLFSCLTVLTFGDEAMASICLQTMRRFLLCQTEIWSHIDKGFLRQGYSHSLGKATYRWNLSKWLCKGKKWHAGEYSKDTQNSLCSRENLSCSHHYFHKNHCFVQVDWIGNILETLESSYELPE